MRTRIGREVELFCTRCAEWKVANETNFYHSSAHRNGTCDEIAVARRLGNTSRLYPVNTNCWVGVCRPCEALRQRARRGNGSTTRPRATGRIFGVELELTGPSAATIIAALDGAGIPMEPHNLRGMSAMSYAATNTAANVWTLKHDSSVSGYGLELVSPKLRGQAGLDDLRKVCYALQSVDTTVDASCGVHVHVDFRRMDLDAIRAQVLPVIRNQENVFRMVAPSRATNHYCPAWNDHNVTELEAMANSATLSNYAVPGPRGVVNLGAFPRHGSVEFRAHGGSTNFSKIGAYVTFLLATLERNASSDTVYASATEWVNATARSGDELRTWAPLLRFENAAATVEAMDYAETREAVSAR